MNDRQRDYFRGKLLAWKDEILRESRITLQTLQEENVNHPDLADRASSETDRAIELRARDLGLGNMAHSIAIGIRTHTYKAALLRADIAYGREGFGFRIGFVGGR